MTFFESLLLLLLAATILLQISRRLLLPYPAMLAAAGVIVALIPGAPSIAIDPRTALPLFIAPVVVDAAFDFPPGIARRLWSPLVALAIVAVLVTAALVAWLGWTYAGLPIAVAVALGAIVAPPDAAAATAVLSSISIPRSTKAVLTGESLFNDATALLLFSAALEIQESGALNGNIGWRLGLAVPGGILLGIGCAFFLRWVNEFVRNTLGGNVLQFVFAFLVWILAERLHVSAILCTVSMAMTIAALVKRDKGTRMRIQSFAVWGAAVFTLNVFAFLLMGLQARTIVKGMQAQHLRQSLQFAVLVVIAVILVRLIVVISFNRWVTWRYQSQGKPAPASLSQAVFVGWSGMRGFVTLATAFALPAALPHRDTVVLTAFGVVLTTLVLQGFTLRPLVKLLKLDQYDTAKKEHDSIRSRLAEIALHSLRDSTGPEAENLKYSYQIERAAIEDPAQSDPLELRRKLGLEAIIAEREELEILLADDRLGPDLYLQVQEEIDWRELTLLREEERRIEES